MNTLCFFSKTAYKKPCFQGLAPRQSKFRPIGRGKRQRKRRGRSLFRPALFLPEHPAACAEADRIGQLHRPAPLLHQLCQQADVLFLRIPHRGNKAVERRFQNERVSALQRLQPPRRLGFRGLAGSLGCIQTCVRKQLFCLPGKVGIRAGRLFTEAGQISSAAALTLRRAGTAPWRRRLRA